MKKITQFIVIYTTFPDLKTANKIAQNLIKHRFIACANIFKLNSIYTWQGKIEKAKEYGALIKTTRTKYKKVENYIKNNHPYKVPEIISWPIERGLKEYLAWIDEWVC